MEITTYIQPTILAMRDEDTDEEGVAHVGRENALIVFRSADEVEKFREHTGMYPVSEGFEPVGRDHVEIARTCVRHNLSRICMPEPWTGDNAVEFFDADVFVKMLRESIEE